MACYTAGQDSASSSSSNYNTVHSFHLSYTGNAFLNQTLIYTVFVFGDAKENVWSLFLDSLYFLHPHKQKFIFFDLSVLYLDMIIFGGLSKTQPQPSHSVLMVLLHQVLDLKRSMFALLFCLPTSLLGFILLFLLTYNGVTVYWMLVPFTVKSSPKPVIFSLASGATQPVQKSSSTSNLSSYSVLLAVKEHSLPSLATSNLPTLQKWKIPVVPRKIPHGEKSRKSNGKKRGLRSVRSEPQPFAKRLAEFFHANNSSLSSCKVRFFMTWISSLKSFGVRELLAVESLFKFHPTACLVIVSKTLDSKKGIEILRPYLINGYRVMAIAPDFDYILKDTQGEAWFDRLKEGNVNPGEVSLGQNISNLLRLVLLYKYGGIYIDTDVLVLRSFSKLRNTIGAQTFDMKTGSWSRLNNAVLIFDRKHPLLYKFIEEFTLTFDGNKWGHNGPYLVSRVVSRVRRKPGFNFTVLPPCAFYPVDWMKIQCLFEGPKNKLHAKWLNKKLEHIQNRAFAVHLWNRQSRNLEVEKGSVIDYIMSSCCTFCNSSESSL